MKLQVRLLRFVPAVDFIRVGSELSCDEAYRGHLIETSWHSVHAVPMFMNVYVIAVSW